MADGFRLRTIVQLLSQWRINPTLSQLFGRSKAALLLFDEEVLLLTTSMTQWFRA